jgi:hypothetical protein
MGFAVFKRMCFRLCQRQQIRFQQTWTAPVDIHSRSRYFVSACVFLLTIRGRCYGLSKISFKNGKAHYPAGSLIGCYVNLGI